MRQKDRITKERKYQKKRWKGMLTFRPLNIITQYYVLQNKEKRENIKRNVEKKMECWPSAYSISLLNI